MNMTHHDTLGLAWTTLPPSLHLRFRTSPASTQKFGRRKLVARLGAEIFDVQYGIDWKQDFHRVSPSPLQKLISFFLKYHGCGEHPSASFCISGHLFRWSPQIFSQHSSAGGLRDGRSPVPSRTRSSCGCDFPAVNMWNRVVDHKICGIPMTSWGKYVEFLWIPIWNLIFEVPRGSTLPSMDLKLKRSGLIRGFDPATILRLGTGLRGSIRGSCWWTEHRRWHDYLMGWCGLEITVVLIFETSKVHKKLNQFDDVAQYCSFFWRCESHFRKTHEKPTHKPLPIAMITHVPCMCHISHWATEVCHITCRPIPCNVRSTWMAWPNWLQRSEPRENGARKAMSGGSLCFTKKT
jgi:hypothetical protein